MATTPRKRRRHARPFLPTTMRAAAIDRVGPASVLKIHELPLPKMGARDVMIAVDTAGVGSWEPEPALWSVGCRRRSFPSGVGLGRIGHRRRPRRSSTASSRRRQGVRVQLRRQEGRLRRRVRGRRRPERRAHPATARPSPRRRVTGRCAHRAPGDRRRARGQAKRERRHRWRERQCRHVRGSVCQASRRASCSRSLRGATAPRSPDDSAPTSRSTANAPIIAEALATTSLPTASMPCSDSPAARCSRRASTPCERGGRVAYPNGIEPAPRKRRGIKFIVVRRQDGAEGVRPTQSRDRERCR